MSASLMTSASVRVPLKFKECLRIISLVCVMESDNQHGWVETSGYPSEAKIKIKILNHLEGGKESFLHKMDIYRNVVGSNE